MQEPTESTASPLKSVLRSESFTEKFVMLLATALVTGLTVPLAIKWVETTREQRAKVVAAQTKLFDEVTKTILTHQTLTLDVSWFGTTIGKNPELQKIAYERYNSRMVELIADWRAQAAKAQTLASPLVAKEIIDLLNQTFVEQDTPITANWKRCETSCDWTTQHQRSEAVLGQANRVIESLARDLGLVQAK